MRDLSPALQTALTARVIQPAILADLTFRSGTVHVWTGIGSLTYNSNVYQGVGNLGGIGTITEGVAVEAAGTTVSLSGIDPVLYADSLSDIITGQPAKIWLACLSGSTVVGTMLLFSGLIDEPKVTEGGDDIIITLALENKLTNLQRANRKLWTAAEQRRKHPTDSGFNWVESLIDTANVWG